MTETYAEELCDESELFVIQQMTELVAHGLELGGLERGVSRKASSS